MSNMPKEIFASQINKRSCEHIITAHTEQWRRNNSTSYTRTDIHEALQAKCDRYERALRFYADRDHVETHGHNLPTYDASSDQDYVENGERAREALNHKESQ